MYSSYQQPQRQPQYAAAATVSIATSSSGLTWNGVSWVDAGTVSTSSLAASGSAVTDWGCNRNQIVPPAPIATYTDYYHKWMEKHAEQEHLLLSVPLMSPDRPAIVRQLEWYKYYADQSSRAAHYFYSHGESNVTTVPFDLPPEPPQTLQQRQAQQPTATSQPAKVSGAHVSSMGSGHSVISEVTSDTSSIGFSTRSPPPDSLKRYVDRCLSQDDNDEILKRKVIEMVKETIESALMNGTLHAINWDTVPLIKVEATPANKNKRSSGSVDHDNRSHHTSSHNDRRYGGFRRGHSRSHSNSRSGSRSRSQEFSFTHPSSAATTAHSVTPSIGSHNLSIDSRSTLPTTNISNSLSNEFLSNSSNKRQRRGNRGTNQKSQSLADRAKRFSGKGGIHDVATSSSASFVAANKNWDRYMGKTVIGGAESNHLSDQDFESMKVKGTCTTLEKNYLRLTSPPKSELVRPEHILEQHLNNLKTMRTQGHIYNGRDYTWFCSQLKAIRQDLTVQHLVQKSPFAVEVYETHARIALEEGDINEFNQCQTQLKELYRSFEEEDNQVSLKNQTEFIAYRLLYFVLMSSNSKYDGGSSDLFNIMLSLTSEQLRSNAVKHALAVREAIADGNYHSFFSLRRCSPNLNGLLLDQMLAGVRFHALSAICKAYRPYVEVSFVLKELGFTDKPNNSEFETSVEYGVRWLKSCGCVLSDDKSIWKTKDSEVTLSKMDVKKTLI